MIEIDGARCGYGDREVLHGVSLRLQEGEFVSVAGPNGAGKSTLLRLMAGLQGRYAGVCRLLGREVRLWNQREFAKVVSFVPQAVRIEFPFTVREVVLMGRAPHSGWMGESPQDAAAAERAMEMTDCLSLEARDVRSLSGGERQRVLVAAALAQEPKVLLLDEPATFLDLEHQRLIYRALHSLRERGVLVCAATHDLNLAARYSTRMLILNGGGVAADGPIGEVLREETIAPIFRVPVVVETRDGRPWVRHGL